jgi:hypothetical protein
MIMRYEKNPWIDPRVEYLRMVQIENYLRRHEWKESNLKATPMRAFRDAQLNGVFLPDVDDDEFLRYAIDAVACLARAEDRYAGDVLTDLLSQPVAVEPKPTVPATAERSEPLAQPATR